jgi:hypothetical protein
MDKWSVWAFEVCPASTFLKVFLDAPSLQHSIAPTLRCSAVHSSTQRANPTATRKPGLEIQIPRPWESRYRLKEMPGRDVRPALAGLPTPPRRRVFTRRSTDIFVRVLNRQETETGMDMLGSRDASATTTACDFGLLDSSAHGTAPAHTRKPLLLFEVDGLLLLRLAQRQLAGLLLNDPPRNTRAPGHHVPAAFARQAPNSLPSSTRALKAYSRSRAGKMFIVPSVQPRQGRPRIAQRFIAGNANNQIRRVPSGTTEIIPIAPPRRIPCRASSRTR